MRKYYQAKLYYLETKDPTIIHADSRSELVKSIKARPAEPILDRKKSTVGMPSSRLNGNGYVPIHFEEIALILSAHK